MGADQGGAGPCVIAGLSDLAAVERMLSLLKTLHLSLNFFIGSRDLAHSDYLAALQLGRLQPPFCLAHALFAFQRCSSKMIMICKFSLKTFAFNPHLCRVGEFSRSRTEWRGRLDSWVYLSSVASVEIIF